MTNTEPHSTGTGEQQPHTSERARTDGGTCVRCGVGAANGIIGELPSPPDPDTTVTMCLGCWAERVAERTGLTEQQAAVVGGESIGLDTRTIKHHCGITASDVRELRKEVSDQARTETTPDAETRSIVGNLNVPLAGQ